MSDSQNTIKSYPERIVSNLPMPFWIPWLIFWAIIFLIDFYFSLGDTHHSYLTEVGSTLFCASICITLGFTSHIMKRLYDDLILFIDHDPQHLKQWYIRKLHWIYGGYRPLVCGAIFLVVGEFSLGPLMNSFNQGSAFIFYFRMGYRLLGFFMLGISLWSMINILLLPNQLLSFKFKLKLSNLSGIGLSALGASFFKMSMATIVCFSVAVFIVMVSPIDGSEAVLIWVGSGSVLIFCFFLLPQIGIHRIMAVEKRLQLVSFSSHIEIALDRAMKDPTSENMQRLKELFELQHFLKNLNDWPFNMTALWQLITALLVPLLLVVMEILFTK